MAIERLLTGSIRERVQDLMSTEDLIIESFKDIVKDELKAHIRNKIEEDPDLHAGRLTYEILKTGRLTPSTD